MAEEITQSAVQNWFDAIAGDDAADARGARKELSAAVYSTGSRDAFKKVLSKRFQRELIARIDGLEDARVRSRYINALGLLTWKMRKSRDDFVDVIFGEIFHPSGLVRHAAVGLARNLSFLFLNLRSTRDEEDAQRAVLAQRARDLIVKHAPKEWASREAFEPIVVPRMKPSVLKSLLMLWETFAHHGAYTEEFMQRYPEILLPLPLQFYDAADAEVEEELDVWERAADVWESSPVTEAVERALKHLEALAKERFDKVVSSLGFSARVFEQRIRAVSDEDTYQDVLGEILIQMAITARNHGWSHEVAGVLVRETLAFANHMVRRTPADMVFSRHMVSMKENISKTYRPRIAELPEAALAARRALNRFIDARITQEKEMRRRLRDITRDDSDRAWEQATLDRLEEARSICHHILDWHEELFPEDLFKRSPERMAAIDLDVLLWHQEALPVKRHAPFTRRELSKFGQWKSTMGYAAATVYGHIQEVIDEPSLMTLSAQPTFEEAPTPMSPLEEPLDADAGSAPLEAAFSEDTGVLPAGVESVGTLPNELDPQELDKRLSLLFIRYGLDPGATLDTVKRSIFESTGNPGAASGRFTKWFISLFPPMAHEQEQTTFEILGASTDAWNAYPHQALGGKSPLEMVKDQEIRRGGKDSADGSTT